MTRYCNKDIKVILTQAILVTFENGFAFWHSFGNHHTEKLIKISQVCKENICGRVPYSQIIFLAVHNNFTCDSETYDLMKLYFETLLEILASSQFKL